MRVLQVRSWRAAEDGSGAEPSRRRSAVGTWRWRGASAGASVHMTPRWAAPPRTVAVSSERGRPRSPSSPTPPKCPPFRSLQGIQRKILAYLQNSQEEYDARMVCEAGGLVVERVIHGLRELLAQNPAYEGHHRRTCHLSCFKTKKAREHARCRYNYGAGGRPLQSATTYSEERGLTLKRDFGHVVPHSKYQLLRDKCNTCLEWILHGKESWAIQE